MARKRAVRLHHLLGRRLDRPTRFFQKVRKLLNKQCRQIFRVTGLKEIGRENWLGFISSRRSTVFHHPAWHMAVELTYGIKPVYVMMSGEDGVIRAGIPGAVLRTVSGARRFVSFPFSDVCGPVADGPEELAAITHAVTAGEVMDKTWSQCELRSEHVIDERYPAYKGYTGHILRLSRPVDDIFGNFHKDCVQRRIRKAFRATLEACEGSSLSDMRDFYGLHLMTRKKLGSPVQPFSFFRNLWNTLYPEGLISLILVKAGGKPVAGVVLLKYGQRVTYKFGASDAAYTSFGANQLAIWTAIKKASDEGFAEFDFGRSFGRHSGLNDFKARWGADEVQLNYLYSPPRKSFIRDEGGRCAQLASSVFRAMPSFSNRLIGRLFYKYLA